jgi:2,3-dihydroxybenzoate decarboxylase/5-carboxyvanillate decarboxylase
MEPAVKFIEDFECTDEERHALCHANAERVFTIAPQQSE